MHPTFFNANVEFQFRFSIEKVFDIFFSGKPNFLDHLAAFSNKDSFVIVPADEDFRAYRETF